MVVKKKAKKKATAKKGVRVKKVRGHKPGTNHPWKAKVAKQTKPAAGQNETESRNLGGQPETEDRSAATTGAFDSEVTSAEQNASHVSEDDEQQRG